MSHAKAWLRDEANDPPFYSFYKNRSFHNTSLQNLENRAIHQLGDYAQLQRRGYNDAAKVAHAKETLRHAFFVGFTDQLDDSLKAFAKKAGLKPVDTPHVRTKRPERPAISDEQIEDMVRPKLALDCELYRWARQELPVITQM